MRSFISYSRKDKDWVYWFSDILNKTAGQSTWIDRKIPVGQDWWQTILSEIENCDAFVIILSPGSVASTYCMEELQYAHELGKPIVPLLLESCHMPDIITKNRIQYYSIADRSNMEVIINEITKQLFSMQNTQSQELAPQIRPDEPKLDPAEGFEQASTAIEQQNYVASERFLQQVLNRNSGSIIKRLAEEKLAEIEMFVSAQKDYVDIFSLFRNPVTRHDALRAWDWYIEVHGAVFDPEGIGTYKIALDRILELFRWKFRFEPFRFSYCAT